MKKIIVGLLIAVVVIAILVVVAVRMFLDQAIKAGVETIGPKITGVEVKLQSVKVSLLSGSGGIKGLVVGNPPGFTSPWAINVGAADLAVEPRSLFSDKAVIKSISILEPQINFETDLKGNNLSKILANVQAAAGGRDKTPAKPQEPAQPKEAGAGKKLQVDDFLIKGAKVQVIVTALRGQSAVLTLPEIHLRDLGKGPEGITAEELTQRILAVIEKEASQASADTVADLAKGRFNIPAGASSNAVDQAVKGIGGFLKKKN
jgi:uncharacterized protein involved in outer membrane biogenesis